MAKMRKKEMRQYITRLTKEQVRMLHEQLLKSKKIPNKKKNQGPDKGEWS